ncbi:DEAD/DEAH box helicase [bacterium]|nr:DEAD/DEAH box helicase [bacterium]
MLEHSPAVATLSAWGEANPAAIRHVLQMPARSGRTVDWPEWVPAAAVDRWRARGIQQPWEHQVLAAQAAVSGSHVAIATGTASGKSLAFAMPIVASIVEGGGSVLSDPCALYLAPTKALANDQWRAWEEAALPGVRPAVVDGDTNTDDRAWARRHANVVLTNPDMLHYSILPGHERWSRLFRNLRYIVVDEAHAYRGVFGAHVSLVLRRLIRIAEHYGSSPVVIAASATSGAPERSAERLIGAPAMAITEDCSPSPERSVVLWQSPNDDEPSSATRDAAALTSIAVEHGCQVLTFLRSRRAVEYVAALVRDNSNAADLGEDSVAAYRGGYLAEERRDLEAGLRSGRLRALASTNALELGIDVAGMDAVITAGWPGTRSSLWQQFGRAGRGESRALAAFIAREDPLDTYLVEHPDAITAQPFEETVFDPSNPHVLLPHLAAAASELPITEDEHVFPDNTSHVLEELVERGLLRKRPTGWYWTSRERPHDMTDLRGSGETVRIVEEGTGRLLGTVDAASAHRHVHPGAVYVHQGVSHTIRALDLDDAVAIAVQEEVDYTTFARDISDIRIRSITRTWSGTGTTMFTGEVEVMSRTVAYEIRALDGTLIGLRDLDLPERLLTTQAVWWTIDDPTVERAGISDLPGAVHAAEHAAIGLLPLFASCDRWDIGGVSTIRHPDTGLATIFIYDGLPGGAGFTARGAEIAGLWLGATADAVSSCNCRDGCPSCVQSPKCGNGNDPLSKGGAREILRILANTRSAN